MGALPMDLGILLTQPRHSASGIFPLPSTLCPGNLWWYKGVLLAGKLKRSKKKKKKKVQKYQHQSQGVSDQNATSMQKQG